jgi:hypothetical protein
LDPRNDLPLILKSFFNLTTSNRRNTNRPSPLNVLVRRLCDAEKLKLSSEGGDSGSKILK